MAGNPSAGCAGGGVILRAMGRESELTHPGFARVYRVVAAAGERFGYGRLRASVLAPASGRLLVLGLGPGHDLLHLPPAVTSVVAVEPDRAMRAQASERVADCAVPVTVLSADAQGPAVDRRQHRHRARGPGALLGARAGPGPRQIRRVLVPGGRLLVLEHVAAPQDHWLARLQRLVEPTWIRAAGGCSLRRDTGKAIEAAGFDTSGLSTTVLWPNLPPVAPHVLGTAYAPA